MDATRLVGRSCRGPSADGNPRPFDDAQARRRQHRGSGARSSRIENYLGFPAGISGAELAERAEAQARKFGATATADRNDVKRFRAFVNEMIEDVAITGRDAAASNGRT